MATSCVLVPHIKLESAAVVSVTEGPHFLAEWFPGGIEVVLNHFRAVDDRELVVFVGSTDLNEWVTLPKKVLVVQLPGLKFQSDRFPVGSELLRLKVDGAIPLVQLPQETLALLGYYLEVEG